MGEKIKNYEKIKIGEQEFDVELNKSHEKTTRKAYIYRIANSDWIYRISNLHEWQRQ